MWMSTRTWKVSRTTTCLNVLFSVLLCVCVCCRQSVCSGLPAPTHHGYPSTSPQDTQYCSVALTPKFTDEELWTQGAFCRAEPPAESYECEIRRSVWPVTWCPRYQQPLREQPPVYLGGRTVQLKCLECSVMSCCCSCVSCLRAIPYTV